MWLPKYGPNIAKNNKHMMTIVRFIIFKQKRSLKNTKVTGFQGKSILHKKKIKNTNNEIYKAFE